MIWLLSACVEPGPALVLDIDLDGEVQGLALSPTGDLLVSTTGSGCCLLRSHNRSTGDVRFEVFVGPGEPMVSDNRIYSLLNDGFVAHDPTTGLELWNVGPLGFVDLTGPAALTPSGDVVFGTHDGANGTVHGYSRLGVPQWTLALPGIPEGPIRVGLDGTAYVRTSANRVHAVRNGALLWSVPASGAPLAVTEGQVYIEDGGVIAVDGTGAEHWRSPVSTGPNSRITADGAGTLWVNGPLATYQFDPVDGTPLAELPTPCGALAYGQDNRMWTVCAGALTALSDTVDPFTVSASPSSHAPVLDAGSGFLVSPGPVPTLLGFTSAALPGQSHWPRASGDSGNTARAR